MIAEAVSVPSRLVYNFWRMCGDRRKRTFGDRSACTNTLTSDCNARRCYHAGQAATVVQEVLNGTRALRTTANGATAAERELPWSATDEPPSPKRTLSSRRSAASNPVSADTRRRGRAARQAMRILALGSSHHPPFRVGGNPTLLGGGATLHAPTFGVTLDQLRIDERRRSDDRCAGGVRRGALLCCGSVDVY